MGKVLVLEDDQELRDFISKIVKNSGHELLMPETFYEGSVSLQNDTFDLVIIEASPKQQPSVPPPWIKDKDGGLSGRSLLKIIIRSILKLNPIPEFIFVARGGFPAEGRYAIENGALDYVQIPAMINKDDQLEMYPEQIKDRLVSAIRFAFKIIDGSFSEGLDLKGIVGNTWQIKRSILRLTQAAKTDENILITGETGTGKRLFAKKIHDNSGRKEGPFVMFDCKAKTETEAKAELFGDSTKRGKIDDAAGGTLFLYRIDSMSLPVQRIFFEVIENHKHSRLTSNQDNDAVTCLISATNSDLKKLMDDGNFRDDLYYEISSFKIKLPSLRDRRTDISSIAKFHIDKICESNGTDAQRDWSPDFMKVLEGYDWPGNIIELINALKISLSNAVGQETLNSFHLPSEIQSSGVNSLFNDALKMNSDVIETVFNLINNNGVSISNEYKKEGSFHEQSQEGVKAPESVKKSIKSVSQHSGQDMSDENIGPTLCFYKIGDQWRIGKIGKEYSINDTKGIQFIHHLLKHPEKNINCIDLYHLSKSVGSINTQTREDELYKEDHKLDHIINSPDRKKIEQKLQKLKDEMKAKANLSANYEDSPEFKKTMENIKFLQAGLKRNNRFFKPEYDKSRTNVQKNIKRALDKIFKEIPTLIKYLEYPTIIKTGFQCSYNPRHDDEPIWILHYKEPAE